MELDIRKCSVHDIIQLVEISKATFANAFESQNNPEDFSTYIKTAFNKQTLLAQLENKDSSFYFLYLGKEILGYIKLNEYEAQTELRTEDGMELERIYVREQFQGNGYGQFMLEKVKSIALANKKAFLWLGVWEKNDKAIRFYHNQNFKQFGTHPYYIGTDKQTDVLMRLDL